MNPAFAIVLVFIGCCSNVVFLEYLVKEAPGCGNIITCMQFLFISIEGFLFTAKCGTKAPAIPLSTYMMMVALFFVVQVTNNYAFAFDIPMTLHMIFRAGSLMANLILGVIILKRRYNPSKYLSVFMITVGIAMATLASANDAGNGKEESAESMAEYVNWLMGIGLLFFALFMSARMGIYQETVYKKHGKHPSEALFYNHALPLPGFLLLYSDISKQAAIFSQSEPMVFGELDLGIPRLWVFLALNVITQYVCIKAVFILTTECTSLTVTLVVTLRKFVSLLFSVYYFSNPFTMQHWAATALVFGGTLIFTDTLTRVKEAVTGQKAKAE